jgi:hypothetical protein
MGIGIPTLVALAATGQGLTNQPIRSVKRAPRRHYPLTVIIYHTSLAGTRASVKAIRRIRSINLELLIVTPADYIQQVNELRGLVDSNPGSHLYIKQSPATRALTVASCYHLVSSTNSVLIIDSGDIVSAATLHSAQRLLNDRKSLTAVSLERTRNIEPTFPSILAAFANITTQTVLRARASFNLPLTHSLPAGTFLRSRFYLRNKLRESSRYSPIAPIVRSVLPEFPYLPVWSLALVAVCLSGFIYSSYLAATLQTIQPLIAVWIICAWWAFVAISAYRPIRRTDVLLLASVAPLMGIIAPSVGLILIAASLQRTGSLLLKRSLGRTRHEHIIHGIFFGTRHP